MNRFFHLWWREVTSYFRTSIAYVAGTLFLAIAGLGFWMLTAGLAQNTAGGDMARTLFGSFSFWLAMLIVTPLLTMRLFAEERRQGTLEMLLTAPVTDAEVVLAKFFGAFALFLLLWLPTLAYAFILDHCGARLPPPDWGLLAATYLGTALVGAFFLSVGLLCSLVTRHQIVAAMICLAALGLLLSAGLLPFYSHAGHIRETAQLFSAPLHMLDFAAGVVDTRTVVWYLSGATLMLFISIRILEARHLR